MNRPTKTLLGKDARKAVYEGVMSIYEPVKRSLGPEGKAALLYRTFNRGSRITDDGVTIAECQEPKNPFIRLAAQAFKEVCKRTVEKVGDGTTTTAVIGGRLMADVYALLSEGTSEFTQKKNGKSIGVTTLGRNIRATAQRVKDEIKARAVKAVDLPALERIATISVKDAELGKVVAKMAYEVGVDGFIDVVEGYKGDIETEIIKGFRFPAKPGAKAFVNNPARYEMVMKDCHVLLTNHELDNAAQLGKTFQNLNSKTSKIIVVAPSFSDNVLVAMTVAIKEGFFIFPVKAPSLRTEQFEDLAITVGAEFIDKKKNRTLQNISFSDLGFCEKMVVKDTEAREDAIVTGGAGSEPQPSGTDGDKMTTSSPVLERIEILKKQLIETQGEQFKKLLERRIASMASAVGVVRVGDTTQASALFLKLKIEDAVFACKAALRGGYVKGGGLCLKEIVEDLKLEDTDILKAALLHPYELIQGSVDGGIEITEDIIDPAEAIYYAVEHATEVVAELAKVEVITPELEMAEPGEGNFAIANAMIEMTIAMKQHLGLINEGQIEAERDSMRGLTVDEMVSQDTG